MFKVSQSKCEAWRTCKRRYYYRYVLRVTRKIISRPLKFGRIVHKMLQEHAAERDALLWLAQWSKQNPFFREEIEEYGDIVADARYVWEGYLSYYGAEADLPLLARPNKNKKATTEDYAELELEVPINKNILLNLTIDGAVASKGMNWLLEHKTHRSFPSPDHRWRNLQSVVYIRALRLAGWWSLDGTLWNYIRSKSPTRPELKLDGTLSERKIDTLPAVILDAAAKTSKPRDYSSMIETAQQNMSSWYERVYTPVKSAVVDAVWGDFVLSAQEMYDARNVTIPHRFPHNIGQHCDFCEFEPLCRAALTGADHEFVLKKEYVPLPPGKDKIDAI
jgi:hypothetical protein